MKRMAKATGAQVQTSCNDLNESILGSCKNFEEKQVGGERFNFFSGCPAAKTCTLVLRGGGAIEMELSAYLRDHSRTIFGKQQLLIGAYAKALEVIPRQVSSNAGMDPTDVLNKLRMKHAHGGKWYGVDVVEGG